MRSLTALSALLLLTLAALAWARNSTQSNEAAAVTAVAQNYMDAYYTADVARMQHALHPEFHKRTLRAVDGELEIVEDGAQAMLDGARSRTGLNVPPDQRVQKIEVLDIYQDAASLKVVTGRWVDYMHLTRLNGEWRVLDVVLQYKNQ